MTALLPLGVEFLLLTSYPRDTWSGLPASVSRADINLHVCARAHVGTCEWDRGALRRLRCGQR